MMSFFIVQSFYFFLINWLTFFSKPSSYREKKSILYLENFPIENAGYQYRVAKWADLLRKEGYQVDIWTLFENKTDFERKIAVKPFSKFLIAALKKRYKQVLASRYYETVIVRRELIWFNDYGNLFMDKLLLKFHPNAILDFDDDIAAAKNQPKKITNLFGKIMLEDGNKFNNTLRLYSRFIVASNYLKKKVLRENTGLNPKSIWVIPTCVDYNKYTAKEYPDNIEKLTFGWIGGSHNYSLLDKIIPILEKLAVNHKFQLLVIGGKNYIRETNFPIKFKNWSIHDEIDDIRDMDIGLMPLDNSKISKGKGGFKLIQYMGMGVTSVASNITINKKIVDNTRNSFLVESEDDWYNVLKNIMLGKYDLSKIGREARKSICGSYTFDSNIDYYLSIFE